MSTSIKIVSDEGRNEATIVDIEDESGETLYSYACSKGAWCDRQNDLCNHDSLEDAVQAAVNHVEVHDEADLRKINARAATR